MYIYFFNHKKRHCRDKTDVNRNHGKRSHICFPKRSEKKAERSYVRKSSFWKSASEAKYR